MTIFSFQISGETTRLLIHKVTFYHLRKFLQRCPFLDEAKIAEQLKQKEVAITVVAEEERLRSIAEADWRSKQASLHLKEHTNRQLLKDDLCRLKDELANLQISRNENFELSSRKSFIFHGSSEESQSGRECIICLKKPASVLFLPCAHQVVCLNCNEEESVRAACPCCQVQIVERVAVYGAN